MLARAKKRDRQVLLDPELQLQDCPFFGLRMC
jgi:hypothetical protein